MTKTTLIVKQKDKDKPTTLQRGDLISFNSIHAYSLKAGIKRTFLSEVLGIVLKVHSRYKQPYLIVMPLDLKGLVSINVSDTKLLNKKRNG